MGETGEGNGIESKGRKVPSFYIAGITCYQETETRAKTCLLGLAMHKSLMILLKGFSGVKGRKA